MNVTEKILRAHLVSGEPVVGNEVGIRIDQTLTQDATGTMAYLQFESMGIDRAKTELSVSYVDHNTVQIGFENADDHDYLQSVAKRFGIVYCSSARTRTRPRAAASAWWPSARAASTWPWRWAAGPIISPGRKSSASA